jgi:hypothetical protein
MSLGLVLPEVLIRIPKHPVKHDEKDFTRITEGFARESAVCVVAVFAPRRLLG